MAISIKTRKSECATITPAAARPAEAAPTKEVVDRLRALARVAGTHRIAVISRDELVDHPLEDRGEDRDVA